jgi:Arm domain-containing DNA-binding protein/integrase-like protein
MAKRTLNDRIIKALKPAKPGRRVEVFDSIVPGLSVRVTDAGVKSFTLATRYPGHKHPARRTIGRYGEVSLERARNTAREWLQLVARGIDPAVEIERQRLAEQRKHAASFAAIVEDFTRDKLSRERKGAEVARDLQREFVPILGRRPISEIIARDIIEIIKPIARRAPYQAHNLLGGVRRLFGWAVDQQAYGIEASPVDRLKPQRIIGERKSRSRILSDDELRALWQVTGEMGYPFGDICRMLLLTAARHHEVSEAPWGEFNLNKGLWTIDQRRFKSNAEHVIPLTDDALALLDGLPRFKRGEYVFSTTFGEKPTVISDKIKNQIDRRMAEILDRESQPWVLHDLRRVVRSHLSALRIPDHVAEMVLGHGRKGIQRVYDQHRYQDELREALTRWNARLRSIVEPTPAKVVRLRG